MTAFVRWNPATLRLEDESGKAVTDAQDAKARRYLEDGKIQKTRSGTVPPSPGFGEAFQDVERYELAPIVGCRQMRVVIVTTHHAASAEVVRVDFACDCQAYNMARRACSHILAVHRHRRGSDNLLAGLQEAAATNPANKGEVAACLHLPRCSEKAACDDLAFGNPHYCIKEKP